MGSRRKLLTLYIIAASLAAASLPPLVCPAGAPIGNVDLRVASADNAADALPLRTINRLEEGNTLLYRPILRSGEIRKGEVALVLVPANKAAAGESLIVLEPKQANKPQQWKVPLRVAVVAYVYGPAGLNTRKVKNFLARDRDLVTQLADYAEKTAQTEALIAALASPDSSADAVQAALHGFSSRYGLNVQLDKNAPANQQAIALFRVLNPAMANYDPISPQRNKQFGETATLATSVASLFFGSPVGLAAGGTAMLMEIRAMAFPSAEFRSSFAQPLPEDGLGLCGRRDGGTPHTRVAYLWALRVPNAAPPQLVVDKPVSLPPALKSPVPVTASDADWKYVERARNWTLVPENGKPVPVKAQKLGDTKTLELEVAPSVKPGRYSLAANWDWKRFSVPGYVDVRALSDFSSARLLPLSQDLLVAKTGKVPVTLAGSDFEFVTKVEVLKQDDKFAAPAAVPFVLPTGLRHGPQERMDLQLNTIDLDPGPYRLLVSQLDAKPHPVDFKILPAPPHIDNFPVVLNEGSTSVDFALKGQRLDLLTRLEVAHATATLHDAAAGGAERPFTLHIAPDVDAGTSLAMKAYIRDRAGPLTFADAVRVVGPRPRITELRISSPPEQDVQLAPGELPGGGYLSAMLRVEHLQSNSSVELACHRPDAASVTLRLGDRSGPISLQQLTPDQLFLSVDTAAWSNGCPLEATVINGKEGRSQPYAMGRIVRVPHIEKFEISETAASLTGQNLETIEKAGWSEEQVAPVPDLPLPVPGEGQRQKLQLHLPPPPAPHSPLFIWLRSESKPRMTKAHS